uniref:Innexin n=1 Tax=Parascaris equorum TaxID=6256 RepID=A0A914RWP1_PAREQ
MGVNTLDCFTVALGGINGIMYVLSYVRLTIVPMRPTLHVFAAPKPMPSFSAQNRMLFLDTFLKGLKPQYVGQPIQCWIPAQFTASAHQFTKTFSGAWEQYSENYCFVQNTYFLPLTHYIPRDLEERENREIGYYQWVPFILGLQGILFYLPCLIWHLLNWQSGIAVKGIVMMSQDVSNMQSEKRSESVALLMKSLNLRIRQLRFAGVTMCDFDVRVLGNKHRHTVQCVLMINMFNEKVYLFLWWWLLIVIIATIGSFCYWLAMSLFKAQQYSFISQYLRVYDLLDGQGHTALEKFVRYSLRSDGVFLLRIVSANAGDLITTDIVAALWKMFLEEEKSRAVPPPALTGTAPKLDDVDHGFQEDLYDPKKDSID